jgi:hypothetical protein
VVERDSGVAGALEKLKAAIEHERASLFVPDRAPLWARGLGDEIRRELPRVPEEMLAYAESTRDYILRDPRPLVVQALVAVFVMLVLGRVSRNVLGRMVGEATTTRAARVLERPYAVGLLLALMASPLFHPLAPRRLMQLVGLVALFPAARILLHASRNTNPAAFAWLFVLLLLERVRAALEPLPSLERAVFLSMLAIALGSAFAFSRHVRRDGARSALGRAANLAMVVLALALLAEIGGWTNLATLLGRGIIAGAVAALYIYAAVIGLSTVLARARIDGDDGVGEHIVAGAIAAIVIRRRARDRKVSEASCRVDRRREGPHVRAAAAFPAVAPRFVERLAGARHGLEFPKFRARAHVERARIAGGALRHFAAGGADDRDVLEDGGRAAVRNTDIGRAVRAEARGERSRGCVERDEVRAAHE